MLQVDKVKSDWKKMPKGLTWYIIGQPKTWKTTKASEWSEKGKEGVLLIDTDLGSDFVDGCKRLTVTSLNAPIRHKLDDRGKNVFEADGKLAYEETPPEERGFVYRTGEKEGKPMPVYSMAEVVFDLEDNWDSYGIDTIVIDTIDQVNDWIEEEVAPDGMKWEIYGKTAKRNMDIMLKLQKLIKRKGGNLILISHSKKTFETDGKVQLSPELPSKLAARYTARADVIGYVTINKKDQNAMISFVGYDERSVGSRLRPLQGKELPFNYKSVREAIIGYNESPAVKEN